MHTPNPTYSVRCQGAGQEKAFGEQLTREFGLPRELGEILHSRGIITLDQAQEFLHPQLSMLPQPERMKGMDAAVACIVQSYRNKEPIFIHGDYDVDGISSTALLMAFFREIGREPFYYIPNRLQEQYGLSIDSINRLVAQSCTATGLLISVDCGITAIEEVRYARQIGLRVVLTDHHEPQEQLPEADAIINPKQPGCEFPCSSLAGAGVVFFLIMALRKALGVDINLKQYLDLAALGTVADVVPLVGANRIIVRAGLEVLSSRSRMGVCSLCEYSGLDERNVLSEDISFRLAPRINAAGRLGEPNLGVQLLLAHDRQSAEQAASGLDRLNNTRKRLESEALADVKKKCSELIHEGRKGLVIYQPECHPGILGILAARVADQFQRPAIVFADDSPDRTGRMVRGSGRSINSINLFQVVAGCREYVEQFGGHAMAIGLTVSKQHLDNFADLFDRQITHLFDNANFEQTVPIDYRIEASMLTPGFARALQWMQPFGERNPEPVFLLEKQRLLSPKSSNGHLIFQIQGSGHVFPGIGFHLAKPNIQFNQSLDLVFQLKRSWYRGVERHQVHALTITAT